MKSTLTTVRVAIILSAFAYGSCRRLGSPKTQRMEEERMIFGAPGSIYYFPWSCWLNTNQIKDLGTLYWPTPFGMCSIFTNLHVFAAVNNLKDIPEPRDPWPPGPQNLRVFYGTDDPGKPDDAQKREVEEVWIGLTPDVKNYYHGNPRHFAADTWTNTSIQWDVIGAAMNIAVIKVKAEIGWSPVVLPIPLFDIGLQAIMKKNEDISRFLDKYPHSRSLCSLASYPITQSSKSTLFMQVAYVPREICKSAYCSIDLSYCFNFPFQWYHVCFRSMTYTDMCKFDQGAALFCNWFGRSIYAILSQTDNCGMEGAPAVYTMISAPLKFWTELYERGDGVAYVNRYGRNLERRNYTIPSNVATPIHHKEKK